MQNILDTPAANQRQQSYRAAMVLPAPVQTVNLAREGAGKISDTTIADHARKTAHISLSAGNDSQQVDQRAQVPAQPAITENTESGVTSAPATTATGTSARHRWPSHPPVGSEDYQRQRDNDHPAASWCSDRGEFVPATGPPPSTCHLHP